MKQIIRYNFLLSVAIILVIVGVAACKKKNSEPPKSFNYTAKLDGQWIGIGTGSHSDYGTSGGAFFPFRLKAIDDTTILGLNEDTLRYDRASSTGGVHFFKDSYSSTYPNTIWHETVSCNDVNSFITDDYYYRYGSSTHYAEVSIHVGTENYKISPLLKTYLPRIVGVKRLSCTVNSHLLTDRPKDTAYSVTGDIEFKSLDELTIAYSKVFIGVVDDTLHYKYTDEAAKTITFQTYHRPQSDDSYRATTLVYNYQNDSLYFEQVDISIPWVRTYARSHT